MRKIAGYAMLFASICIAIFVVYKNTSFSNVTRTFSTYSLLSSSWETYKTGFIRPEGRVIDKTQNDVTTSEGQSYALLRAVWMDDKDTFDLVWKWTRNNLKRPNDKLFGWQWGKRPDGSYGYISDGSANAASDADTDIALALILASRRWNEDSYLKDALQIIDDIWLRETDTVGSYRYLIAGNWAKNDAEIIVNPSYFAPYAWRIFAEVDTDHDWESMISPAYELLRLSGGANLDKASASGLPPDWVAISRTTGELKPASIPNASTNYGYDAVRTPWRIALDYSWSKDPLAREYLVDSFDVLKESYKTTGKLVSTYAHDGHAVTDIESPVMYATSLGYFMNEDRKMSDAIYQEKLLKMYSNGSNSFREDLPYYEQNWLWFGVALYSNYLDQYAR